MSSIRLIRSILVVIVDDKPLYIFRKRLDEIVARSEDEGWSSDDYPHICFILKDHSAKYSFLYTTEKKLESMGLEDDELPILAASIESFDKPIAMPWASPLKPTEYVRLFA